MIIGIDLGTTNSLVSYFTEDGPRIIPNRLGKNLTPSVVSIDENDQIYVGDTAKERELLFPGTSASIFKRDMGSSRKFQLGNKQFSAEELSSFILRALREDAEAYLGQTVTEAIISVPAYFNDIRRKATIRAGELAGLKVDRIISEPTAAAIAYGLYQDRANKKFMVFDLGGGTFDVSILELFNSIIEVRAVAGDNFLGGEDFTNVLEQSFYEENPHIKKELLSDKTRKYIHKQMEICKLELSVSDKINKTFMVEDEELLFSKDIASYEADCEELFEKIRNPIRRSLADANIRIKDIDKVVVDLGLNWIEKGHFCPIIERNTTIPVSRTERLYTVYDNQEKIRVNILQGESRYAANNISLGEINVSVPKAKKGEEAIDVTYTYDVNSILEVVVKVISTEKTVKKLIKGQNTDMTDEEIKRRFEELSYLKIAPRDREENKLLLLRGERLYEEALSRDRQIIDYEIHKFEYALKSQERDEIEAARSKFKKFLDEYDRF